MCCCTKGYGAVLFIPHSKLLHIHPIRNSEFPVPPDHSTLFLYMEMYKTFSFIFNKTKQKNKKLYFLSPHHFHQSPFFLLLRRFPPFFCPCWLKVPCQDHLFIPAQNGMMNVHYFFLITPFSHVPYFILFYSLCITPSVIILFSMSRILCCHQFSSLLYQIFSFFLLKKTWIQALRIFPSGPGWLV